MSLGGWFGRSVRRSERFDELGAALAGRVERLDEVIAGLEHILSNRPDCYPFVPGSSNVRVARTQEFDEGSVLVVYYSVSPDGEVVTLEWIEQAQAPDQ